MTLGTVQTVVLVTIGCRYKGGATVLWVYDKIDNRWVDTCTDKNDGIDKIKNCEALDRMDKVYKPNRYELREG